MLYGLTLSWLTGFTIAGYVGVAVLQAAMLALTTALVPTARWPIGAWGLPAALALLDLAQSRFPFDGFPLPALALSQAGGPFAAAAPWGGTPLVAAMAGVAGVALAVAVHAVLRRRLVRAGVVTMAAVVVVGAPVLAEPLTATLDAGTLNVAVVQGGGTRGLRAVFTNPQDTTDRQFAVADRISGSPDLVLLPENVITVEGPVAGTVASERVARLARRLSAPVVVGVVERLGGRFANAAVLWDPDGTIGGRYEKEHRVPFGEYIPARALLEKVTDLTALVPRDAIPGVGTARLDSPSGPLGVVISYEVLFTDRVREAVTAGGRVVLVPTNAASYTTEDVPAIEVAGARLRARETGRAVVQAAPTGYSVAVLPDGTVMAQTQLAASGLLTVTIPLRDGFTPYTTGGDVPVLTAATAALLAVWLVPAARRRRAPAPSAPPAGARPSPRS